MDEKVVIPPFHRGTPSRSTEVDSPSTLVNKSTPIPKHGHWVKDFEIPWYKMPQSLLQACEQRFVRNLATDEKWYE
jgi:hypothetical protein